MSKKANGGIGRSDKVAPVKIPRYNYGAYIYQGEVDFDDDMWQKWQPSPQGVTEQPCMACVNSAKDTNGIQAAALPQVDHPPPKRQEPLISTVSGCSHVTPYPMDNPVDTVITASERNQSQEPQNDRVKRTNNLCQYMVSSREKQTFMGLSLLVALFFNCPCGLLAMFVSMLSSRAYQQHNDKLGERLACYALFVSLLGVIVTALTILMVVYYITYTMTDRINPS